MIGCGVKTPLKSVIIETSPVIPFKESNTSFDSQASELEKTSKKEEKTKNENRKKL